MLKTVMKMKIYLVRHGITDWNVEGRFQGREDIALNGLGRDQAEECREALENIEFERAFSSPLKRSIETAEIVLRGKDLPIEIIEDLIERDYGVLSGTKPVGNDLFVPDETAEGIEPLENVIDRMYRAVELCAGKTKGDILIASHGGAINALIYKLSGGKIGSGKTRLKNACICILETDGDSFKIVAYNISPSEYKTGTFKPYQD